MSSRPLQRVCGFSGAGELLPAVGESWVSRDTAMEQEYGGGHAAVILSVCDEKVIRL